MQNKNMYKNREEIEKEFDERYDFYEIFGNNSLSEKSIKKFIHQIRQDDLEEVKKIIKEKGLHLGYGNDILDKLDNLIK